MGPEFSGSVIVPSCGVHALAAPWLCRVPWGGFPGFVATMGRSDSRTPFPPRSGFPLLGGTSTACSRSLPATAARRFDGARAPWVSRRPHAGTLCAEETSGPPRFLGDPRVRAPFSDPDGASAPDPLGASVVPSTFLTVSASAMFSLSGLHHAARTLAVYASQPGSPPDHATLGSGWWPTFAGSGLSPAGSHRRFPSWLSIYMTSPLTKLCLAQ